jgi:hypothetical protein
MRRTAVLAAVLAIAVVPRAEAAEAVPEPTLAVSVTAAGQPLPKATTTASWIVGTPGAIAKLTVDSYNVPGAVTTVDAVWTSRDVKVHGGIPAMEYKVQTTHQAAPTSSMPASVSYGIRWREAGGRWSPWYDVADVYESGNPLQGISEHVQLGFGTTRRKLVQFQFRIHTEMADVGKDHQEWDLLAYT